MKNGLGSAERGARLMAAALASALLVMMLPALASAQLTEEEKKYLEEKQQGPSTVYAVTLRPRVITVPDFIIDAFFSRHASTWDGTVNMESGTEFIIRKPKSHEFVFSAHWSDLRLKDEWWLEDGKPARQADWTEFDMSLVTVDASYNAWWPLSDVFAFYLGAGLGLGVVIGEVLKTDPTTECIIALGAERDDRKLEEPPCENQGQPALDTTSTQPEDDIPPVLPILNVTGGAQVTIEEHLVLRFDLGFKYYFFGGISVGYQWF